MCGHRMMLVVVLRGGAAVPILVWARPPSKRARAHTRARTGTRAHARQRASAPARTRTPATHHAWPHHAVRQPSQQARRHAQPAASNAIARPSSEQERAQARTSPFKPPPLATAPTAAHAPPTTAPAAAAPAAAAAAPAEPAAGDGLGPRAHIPCWRVAVDLGSSLRRPACAPAPWARRVLGQGACWGRGCPADVIAPCSAPLPLCVPGPLGTTTATPTTNARADGAAFGGGVGVPVQGLLPPRACEA